MANVQYINLRARPELIQTAAEWFHSKWGVPLEVYLSCMTEYLRGSTELGRYLCLARGDGEAETSRMYIHR